MWPYIEMADEFLNGRAHRKSRLGNKEGEYVQQVESSLEARDIYFSYGKKNVTIKGISGNFPKGSITALVGPSGGGKSSFLEILSGFQQPEEGQVLLDGRNLLELDLRSYQRKVGYVSQEMILFNDTIYNNLTFLNPEATEQEVVEAAKTMDAHDFISKSENGY